jgi:tricorn protease-like protein
VSAGVGDETMKVWDLESGFERATLRGHSAPINAVAVTPDGRLAVSASDDETLRVWDLKRGTIQTTMLGHASAVHSVAVTPDGQRAVSGSGNGTLKVWDLKSGAELVTMRRRSGTIAVMPDGRLAMSESKGGTLKVWDLESGGTLATYTADGVGFWCSAHAPDGRSIVLGDSSGRVHFLRLEGVTPGPALVTAWRGLRSTLQQIARGPAVPRWQFWNRQPVLEAGEAVVSPLAFGCLHCRTWSHISESALGTELPCPHCGTVVRLNPFAVEADWQPVAAAWKGER